MQDGAVKKNWWETVPIEEKKSSNWWDTVSIDEKKSNLSIVPSKSGVLNQDENVKGRGSSSNVPPIPAQQSAFQSLVKPGEIQVMPEQVVTAKMPTMQDVEGLSPQQKMLASNYFKGQQDKASAEMTKRAQDALKMAEFAASPITDPLRGVGGAEKRLGTAGQEIGQGKIGEGLIDAALAGVQGGISVGQLANPEIGSMMQLFRAGNEVLPESVSRYVNQPVTSLSEDLGGGKVRPGMKKVTELADVAAQLVGFKGLHELGLKVVETGKGIRIKDTSTGKFTKTPEEVKTETVSQETPQAEEVKSTKEAEKPQTEAKVEIPKFENSEQAIRYADSIKDNPEAIKALEKEREIKRATVERATLDYKTDQTDEKFAFAQQKAKEFQVVDEALNQTKTPGYYGATDISPKSEVPQAEVKPVEQPIATEVTKQPEAQTETPQVKAEPKPAEEHLVQTPLHELPEPIKQKFQAGADDLISEVKNSSIERTGAFVKKESTHLGEDVIKQGSSTINTFPEWFSNLGRGKADIIKALEKIKEDNGKDKGKLVNDLKEVLLERFKGEQEDIMRYGGGGKFKTERLGKIPGDSEIMDFLDNVKDNVTLDQLHDEYAKFEKETSFNPSEFEQPFELTAPKETVPKTKPKQESLFTGESNKPAFPEQRSGRGKGVGEEGSPLFEQPKTDKGQLELPIKRERLIADDAYEQAKKNIISKGLGQLGAGIDPTILKDYAVIGAYHLENGIVTFADFARKMRDELGDKWKEAIPHLKTIYDESKKLVIKNIQGSDLPNYKEWKKEIKGKVDAESWELLKPKLKEEYNKIKTADISEKQKIEAENFPKKEIGSSEQKLTEDLKKINKSDKSLSERLDLAGRTEYAKIKTGGAISDIFNKVKAQAKTLWDSYSKLPKWTEFKSALGDWSRVNEITSRSIQLMQKELEKKIPSKLTREGITNWIQAEGDRGILEERMNASNRRNRLGYEKALELTPEEIEIAETISKHFDEKLQEAIDHGVIRSWVENYVPQIYKKNAGGKLIDDFGESKIATNVKFAKQRIFQNYFEAEQAGKVASNKDISKLLGVYDQSISKAANNRVLVERLKNGKAQDERPLSVPMTEENIKKYRDYEAIPNAGLKGQLFHPEIRNHLKNATSSSALANVPGIKQLTSAQGVVKQTMLSLSPFHYVQEGTHAIGHTVNPFTGFSKFDLKNPLHNDLLSHGLSLYGHKAQISEGL